MYVNIFLLFCFITGLRGDSIHTSVTYNVRTEGVSWCIYYLFLFSFPFIFWLLFFLQVHEWKQWKRLSQYSETERDFRLQTYFKFMFVREPLHRLLSAYKDKFTTLGNPKYSPHYREKIIKSYRPDDFKPGGENFITFAEFIKYYSQDINPDQHWRQYERLCHPCFVNYDFIGRLETLEEDGTLLLKMAGIDDRVTFPAVHRQTSSDEVLKYYSQVPSEDIIRIGKQYVSDFLLFGYDYLGPVKLLLNGTWPPVQ